MSKCTVCNEERSPFVMNNKTVCFKCDELLFDIEIECEDAVSHDNVDKSIRPEQPKSISLTIKK